MRRPTATQRAARMAERVLIEGRLVHPRANHGTLSAYNNFGCRCLDCSARELERKKRARQPRPDGEWTRLDSMRVDEWARSHPNRTPLQCDPHLYALLHDAESVAA
ncbi:MULTISPECIES: hypothetical protein [Rhodococcus erythropolis group]|uniref:hypothetical protein n=1 Tax=Rhodococcus erythropolis group TaxID=2840174 RepID=UPI000AD47772|nr:hypothetical protein [Rhodococcus qingshengii]BCF84563.1 hypothetical protein RQCS_41080 [Rhodococcus qingshengii]